MMIGVHKVKDAIPLCLFYHYYQGLGEVRYRALQRLNVTVEMCEAVRKISIYEITVDERRLTKLLVFTAPSVSQNSDKFKYAITFPYLIKKGLEDYAARKASPYPSVEALRMCEHILQNHDELEKANVALAKARLPHGKHRVEKEGVGD